MRGAILSLLVILAACLYLMETKPTNGYRHIRGGLHRYRVRRPYGYYVQRHMYGYRPHIHRRRYVRYPRGPMVMTGTVAEGAVGTGGARGVAVVGRDAGELPPELNLPPEQVDPSLESPLEPSETPDHAEPLPPPTGGRNVDILSGGYINEYPAYMSGDIGYLYDRKVLGGTRGYLSGGYIDDGAIDAYRIYPERYGSKFGRREYMRDWYTTGPTYSVGGVYDRDVTLGGSGGSILNEVPYMSRSVGAGEIVLNCLKHSRLSCLFRRMENNVKRT